MSMIDRLLTDARALAFRKGQGALAAEIGVSSDTLRRLLKERAVPAAVKNLRKLEAILEREKNNGLLAPSETSGES